MPSLRLAELLGAAGDALQRPVDALGQALLEQRLGDVAHGVHHAPHEVLVVDRLEDDLDVALQQTRLGEVERLRREGLVPVKGGRRLEMSSGEIMERNM